jgi:hypothetical protein
VTALTEEQFQALSALRFDWAMTPDDVWSPHPEHVPELQQRVGRRVLDGLGDAKRSRDSSPLGLAIQGSKGSGKTHLLGWVREQVLQAEGYFFLVGVTQGEAFWPNVVEAMLDGLWRETGNDRNQLQLLLERLGTKAGASRQLYIALSGPVVSRRGLDGFVKAIQEIPGARLAPEILDTVRALVLYASKTVETQDIAKDYLGSAGGVDAEVRTAWGIRSGRSPELIVRDLSRLMALTGPSVIAIDQIDALIAREATSWDVIDSSQEDEARDHVVGQVSEGVMALREVTRRTLTIVACLPNTWQLIQTRAFDSVRDRFKETSELQDIPTPEIGRMLIERRYTARFAEIGFRPPYPTWPIAPEAFESAVGYTPRALLQRVDTHIQGCLDAGELTELRNLDQAPVTVVESVVSIPATDLARLDARRRELEAAADVESAFDPTAEDRVVPGLLTAGLLAWIEEQGEARGSYSADPLPGKKATLHARLRLTLNEDVEAEKHWAFKAICSSNDRAVQSRIPAAQTLAGIQPGDTKRSLFLLRSAHWPKGPKTRAILEDFRAAGGQELPITNGDLRTFAALKTMLAERDPALRHWLGVRRPASSSEVFGTALPKSGTLTDGDQAVPAPSLEPTPAAAQPEQTSPPTNPIPVITLPPAAPGGPLSVPSASSIRSVELGRAIGTEQPVTVELEALRKHVAIFAGSGSGKTVLIRRLVEECALQGVSSIVLDPNNDLARLGDAWPEPPANWGPDDPDKAKRYLEDTDVVVWTPRRESGRPLTFQPLPDFASVLDDPDEFRMAVDVAFGALAPRVRAEGRTRKAQQEQAVLRESLEFFARGGGGDLDDLVDLMENLPPEASRIGSSNRMAAEMAQTLTAAMVNDPLFGGIGQALDPAVLLTPAAGKRARVSVISLIGLPDDGQRQGFVSQLQMALFAWFKKHPSAAPLGGLLVMDEAQTLAPSGPMTVSTGSTLVLASQARKYGLGLVFATQAPKGLHNRIPGNAATQIYGFLNSPNQIATAREFARAKGGDVSDISQLKTGQFYLAGEGASFVKIQTAFCLSHHPSSPLSADDVIARARVR